MSDAEREPKFLSAERDNTIDVRIKFERFGRPDKVLAELTRTLNRVIALNAGGGTIESIELRVTNSERNPRNES